MTSDEPDRIPIYVGAKPYVLNIILVLAVVFASLGLNGIISEYVTYALLYSLLGVTVLLGVYAAYRVWSVNRWLKGTRPTKTLDDEGIV